jgi:excisionase family DNA binding protein
MRLLSIQEAARELGLDPSRVRALVSSGELHGVKLGERWAVESTEVARRRRDPKPAGRPFAPGNAWGILFLASGLEAPWLEPSVRWRLEQGLAFRGLAGLRPRLSRRAEVHHFHAHPGELRHFGDRPDVLKSGISAAGHYELGLVPGEEVDGYVRARALKRIQRESALEPVASGRGNVILRAVPDGAWHLNPKDQFAPIAAVAVDLAEDSDPRSSRIGKDIIKRLDRDLKASR